MLSLISSLMASSGRVPIETSIGSSRVSLAPRLDLRRLRDALGDRQREFLFFELADDDCFARFDKNAALNHKIAA